jgi:hypothetical protein
LPNEGIPELAALTPPDPSEEEVPERALPVEVRV